MKGIFITMEGGDGSGKSTQMALLKAWMKGQGLDFIDTREPGGTIIGEAIRDVILNPTYQEMDAMTECLLYAASRAQHVAQKIKPALQKGQVVLCDRFVDSSLVYQGYARGLGEGVALINAYATDGLKPDLTIFLDLSHEAGLDRKKNQQDLDRLEAEADAFHKKVRDGYEVLTKAEPERFLVVDASLPIQTIHQQIIKRFEILLK